MRILLVDDEPEILKFYNAVLQSLGYKDVDSVGTGEAAVSKVLHGKYELIVLDISMPGLSGLEIISILRNMCPHGVIAIVSGHIPDHIPKEAIECADLLIAKPIALGLMQQLLALAQEMEGVVKRVQRLSDCSLVPEELQSVEPVGKTEVVG